MATINFLVPPLFATKFSGGLWCIMQYASGLADLGHEVFITPILPGPTPSWAPSNIRVNSIGKAELRALLRSEFWKTLNTAIRLLLRKESTESAKKQLRSLASAVLIPYNTACSYEVRRAISLSYSSLIQKQTEITVATSYETAIIAHLYGSGEKYYFLQHYEPLFKDDKNNPILAEFEAEASYHLPLQQIANSSWLKNKVEESTSKQAIFLCNNAINHEVFQGEPKLAVDTDDVTVISYGGRDAIWKGFYEMAQGMRIARERMPQKNIRWLVYGDALLPPNNDIASYEPLGFLSPERLADAYRSADLLLSASWYESFPLFPLEAMACGLPTITTAFGTEDFAKHGITAEICEAKNYESIANSLVRLISDVNYRNQLAVNGHRISKDFTWERSFSQMERILTGNAIARAVVG